VEKGLTGSESRVNVNMIEEGAAVFTECRSRVGFSGAYVKSLNGILKRTPHNLKNGGFYGLFGGWRVSFEYV
jgi:hypothetical protein